MGLTGSATLRAPLQAVIAHDGIRGVMGTVSTHLQFTSRLEFD